MLAGDIELNPGPPENDISIFFSNINSIRADDGVRFEYFKNEIIDNNIMIAGLCEVGNISANLNEYAIDGYNIQHYSSENRGLILYVHDLVNCTLRPDLTAGSIECIWADFRINYKVATIGFYYRSPSQVPGDRKQFMSSFRNAVSKSLVRNNQLNSSVIVLGDFNARNTNWCKTDPVTDTAGRELKLIIDDLLLLQMVNEPTRIARNSQSCIDLLISDSPGLITSLSILPPIGNSDHCSILAKWECGHYIVDKSKKTKTFWQFNKCDREKLNNDNKNTNWDENGRLAAILNVKVWSTKK